MWKTIERWLRLDQFGDPQAQTRALTLYVVLLLAGLAALSLGTTHFAHQQYDAALVMGMGLAACAVMLSLTWRGLLDQVSWLLPSSIYVIMTLRVLTNDWSTRPIGYSPFNEAMFMYPALIILGALLCGRRGAMVFTLVSMATVLAVGGSDEGAPYLLVMLTLLGLTGGAAYLVINRLLMGLMYLGEKELALDRANAQLRGLKADLEARRRGSIIDSGMTNREPPVDGRSDLRQ